MPNFLKNKKLGFTLIELLVVIAIAGLILSITMIALKNSREKARLTSIAQFVATTQHSLGAYGSGAWAFKEGVGTSVKDSTGNGNDGTVSGASWVADNPSGAGWSLNFNGANNWVDCGNKSGLNLSGKATIVAWVKMTALPGASAYGVLFKGDNYKFGITQNAPAGRVLAYNGSTTIYSTKLIPAGEWHHIAISINSGTATFYVDGVVNNSASFTLGATNTNNLFIGKGLASGEYFNGLISDVRIYSEAITLAQIQKIYAEEAEQLGLARK